MIDRFKPANDDELTLVERIAIDIWTSDRAAQAGSRRLAERLRHEPLERTRNEKDEAIELGGRLLWQPAFPLPITRRFQIGELTEPPQSDHAIHPHHPARLCLRLEQTVAGCDWLIDRWRNLRQRLNHDGVWSSSAAFQMVRLMGKLAIDMADDLEVTDVFLASLRLLVAPQNTPEPESFDWKYALIRMLMTFDTDSDQGDAALATEHCAPFARRLAELPLAKMAPRDDEQARKSLSVVIARSWHESARSGRSCRRSPMPTWPRRPPVWHSRPGMKAKGIGVTCSPTSGCSIADSPCCSKRVKSPRQECVVRRRLSVVHCPLVPSVPSIGRIAIEAKSSNRMGWPVCPWSVVRRPLLGASAAAVEDTALEAFKSKQVATTRAFCETPICPSSVVRRPLPVARLQRSRSPPFRWGTVRPPPRTTMAARTGTTSRRLP